MRAFISTFLFLLLCCVAAPHAALADSDSARVATDISGSLMSPYCPGRTISACPSDKARELRNEIVAWVEGGKTSDEVQDILYTRYGQEIYGVPASDGVGALSWTLPVAFAIVGCFILYWRVKRMQAMDSPTMDTNDALGDEDVTKQDSALDKELVSKIEQDIKDRLAN